MNRHVFHTALASLTLAATACGPATTNTTPDGGTTACTPETGTAAALNDTYRPCFTQTAPNRPGSIEVTFSGETLGVNGLPFQPANEGDPVFVDGWSMTFEEFLVVVGNVRLQKGATDTAQQNGLTVAPVAEKKGPWVIDVHKPSGFVGSDGQEPAGGIFKWDAQDDGTAFDSSALYALSYATAKASKPATQVNLTKGQFPDYDLMVQHGWSKFLRGTATYVGAGHYADAALEAKFAALPKTVHFTFGWNDATSYLNCVNPDNGSGDGAGEDLKNRGIRVNTSGASLAQITLHVDHLFWDILRREGTPLRFDPIAAWAPADTGTTPLELSTLAHPLATTFGDGTTPLPDRAPVQNVPGGYTSDQANPSQIVLGLGGVPSANVSTIAQFMAFSSQSQLHLNADGLCYVVGQNETDPFFKP